MSAPDPFAGRVTDLNDAPVRRGSYVLYWMQRSQRAVCNHALEYAVGLANRRALPVVVGFGLTPDYPDASERHYRFMLEGLREVAATVRNRGMAFVLRIGLPPTVALELGKEAAAIVCDRAYVAHARRWRYEVARASACRVVEVESDLIVPVEAASSKLEYAARTIRPRVLHRLPEFLVSIDPIVPRCNASHVHLQGEPIEDTGELIRTLSPAASPASVTRWFTGGHAEARRRLDRFVTERLTAYESSRNDPGYDVVTGLSPYLHFGQISDLEITLELPAGGAETLRDQLIVRRGLAHNYAWYAPDCASYRSLPDWARRTLEKHTRDERPYTYSMDDLLAASTHDVHWNTAMRELTLTGSMHTYMRMYWGKKILEWTADPRDAFERLLLLNNRWFLDGRDPNSYANVGWVFGLHDRPWTERSVFGTVRYMNAAGLERKFDMTRYQRRIDRLHAESESR